MSADAGASVCDHRELNETPYWVSDHEFLARCLLLELSASGVSCKEGLRLDGSAGTRKNSLHCKGMAILGVAPWLFDLAIDDFRPHPHGEGNLRYIGTRITAAAKRPSLRLPRDNLGPESVGKGTLN